MREQLLTKLNIKKNIENTYNYEKLKREKGNISDWILEMQRNIKEKLNIKSKNMKNAVMDFVYFFNILSS